MIKIATVCSGIGSPEQALREKYDKEKQIRLSKETKAKSRILKFNILKEAYKPSMNWVELHRITGISVRFIRIYRKDWLC